MSRSTRSAVPLGILILAALIFAPGAGPSAATPQTIKVQGALTDRVSGNPVPAQGVFNMTFALFDNEFGGLPITTVGPLPVDVQQGRFQAELPLSTAQFQLPDRYLSITVNGETLTPRIRLTSTPFALVADQSATASSSSTAGVALSVTAGGVGTAALASGAVTSDKLGIPCANGEILVRSGGAWVCAAQPQTGTICGPGSFVSCYTGPAGTLNVGACRAGAAHCNAAGTAFEGCEGQIVPIAEVCDAADNNCDGATDEANICPPCPDADGDGFTDAACVGGTDCNDQVATIHPGRPELCNGYDDDCNSQTIDGTGDPQAGTDCDGGDSDACLEGVRFCASGNLLCSDTTGGIIELCNGLDDDCNGSLPASEQDNDGDGYKPCTGDCNDANAAIHPGVPDICDAYDNDCDSSTPNGSGDGQQSGLPCDGPDPDLCLEGVSTCTSNGTFQCSDATGGTFDVCNGLDDDCDPSSPDGSEDFFIGQTCDGPDADNCMEGAYVCTNGTTVCTDNTGNTVEVCGDAIDNDCDGAIDEGC